MSSKEHSPFHVFRAILILPVNVLITIPFLIWYFSDRLPWPLIDRIPDILKNSLAGLLLISGLALMFQTIRLFSNIGKGTLAPWNPTRKLVVKGPYRYVRNPMISGVLLVLIGEFFLFRSYGIFLEALLFFTINYIYFVCKEEPDLEKRFGEEYLAYKQNVPRWIPRLSPYHP